MTFWRIVLAVLLPPLAVIDQGVGKVLLVLLLTCIGWLPGVISAFVILNKLPKQN